VTAAPPEPDRNERTLEQIRERCLAVATAAARARPAVASLTGEQRDTLLRTIADGLDAETDRIIAENTKEIAENTGLEPAMRDRLTLTTERVRAMADAVRSIAAQPAVLGEIAEGRVLPSGVRLEKRRVPLGTVLVIYEARPNVTSDAAALCLKSGNAVILKGGREALRTNTAIAGVIKHAVRTAHPERPELEDAVTLISDTDRAAVTELVGLDGLIDLAIPRGGPGLIRAVTEAARVPVVKHDAGVCHLYIDGTLEGMEDAAVAIAVNAKCQRPGVCNAIETLLVHASVAARMLPLIGGALRERGVEVRGCGLTRAILPWAAEATEADWAAEYLGPILAVRVVGSLDEAGSRIERYGSHHTDAIVTSSQRAASEFSSRVTSASVMINCSTRFADGGEYGLGAEIGISTDKLHARGPMGARDLTTTQWVATGEGQVRG